MWSHHYTTAASLHAIVTLEGVYQRCLGTEIQAARERDALNARILNLPNLSPELLQQYLGQDRVNDIVKVEVIEKLRRAFFISAFSTLEVALIGVTLRVLDQSDETREFKKFGRSSFERVKEALCHAKLFELFFSDEDWEKTNRYKDVRNSLVHASGLRFIDNNWEKTKDSIRETGGEIMFQGDDLEQISITGRCVSSLFNDVLHLLMNIGSQEKRCSN
ncbi:MAG: hypothetical protein AAF322_01045 [Pseudomonadota bacterium]